ncbi:primosomal protein N' [Patescibacteria group bacterium]|nr:primosomal protein N' [Patescibacteria group bacterium]
MFIISVVPLKRIPRGIPQALSYFSSKPIKSGVLVMAKIRAKDTLAIVASCEDAKNLKIEIKKSDFELRPISKIVLSEPVLTKQQIEIAYWISNYYVEPLSLVFKSITPEPPVKIKNHLETGFPSENMALKQLSQPIPLLLKSNSAAESLNFLENKIKKTLGENRQILILAPENASVQNLTQILKNKFPDIEILKIAKKSAKNKFWVDYNSIKSGKSRIIIGTRSAALLPFVRLGMIIVIGEHNDSHKQWEGHPLYDSRDVAGKIAEIFKAKVIFESYSPAAASFWKAKNSVYDFIDIGHKKEKNLIEIINMRYEQKKGNYSIFSEYFIDKLKNVIQNKQRAVLFLNRRGAANFIICKVCGNIAKCPTCQIPLVFYANNEFIDPEKRNKLLCNHCGFITDLPRQCSKCKGFEIKYLGLGTQKAESQLKKTFSNITVLRMDGDSAKNSKDAEKILNLFKSTLPSILVGTRQFLSAARMPEISFIGIVSLDAMLAIPDFKTDEKVFSAVWQLKNICKDIAIQTYSPDHPLLKSFTALDYESFAEKELANRRLLFYPPFSKIIKLKLKSPDRERGKNEVEIISNQIQQRVKDQVLRGEIKISKPVPAFIFQEKGFYNWHIIIKIKNEEILKSLHNDKLMLEVGRILAKIIPQNWEINVNPDTII